MPDSSVPLWDNVDLDFTSAEFTGSPFDIRLWADFHGPNRSELRVPGYYAGDGRWVVRFMGPAAGAWDYATESDIPGLRGRTGRVMVGPARPANRGRLVADTKDQQSLRWEDGSPYFLIGFEADWLAVCDAGEPEPARALELIDALAGNGFNHVVMNVYAWDAPWPGCLGRDGRYDFSHSPRWPFAGTNEHPDHELLDPGYFDNLDRVVAALRERGVICHLMVYVWNKQVAWPAQDSPADRRYFDYVLARYQGYSNVVWDVSKEALHYGYCGSDYIAGKCRRVRELDAFGHLLTVHDRDFCEERPDLVDIVSVQDWRSELYPQMLEMRGRHPAKPVYNIEHGGYEASPFINAPGDYQDAVVCLERNYLCLFAGVYSTYYWQGCSWNIVCYEPWSLPPEQQPRFEYFRHMQEFFTRHPFHEYEPVPPGRLLSSGYLLRGKSDPGRMLVLKPAASYRIHLRAIEGVKFFSLKWFNPLTGQESAPEKVVMEHFTALRSPWKDVFCIACIVLD